MFYFGTRLWRNWYTRSTKDAVEQSLGVQVPPAAPPMFVIARKAQKWIFRFFFVILPNRH